MGGVVLKKMIFAVCLAAASPAFSQAQELHVTASNGIIVDVNADDFANRYEYSAPPIRFGPDSTSFALVARIKRAEGASPVHIEGVIYYRGDWRFYEQALYRGGGAATYRRVGGEVVSCSGSRYGGCSLSESFHLDFTPAEVRAHAENGTLTVQLRARSGEPMMLDIPVSYIDAVTEVSGRPSAQQAPVSQAPTGK